MSIISMDSLGSPQIGALIFKSAYCVTLKYSNVKMLEAFITRSVGRGVIWKFETYKAGLKIECGSTDGSPTTNQGAETTESFLKFFGKIIGCFLEVFVIVVTCCGYLRVADTYLGMRIN